MMERTYSNEPDCLPPPADIVDEVPGDIPPPPPLEELEPFVISNGNGNSNEVIEQIEEIEIGEVIPVNEVSHENGKSASIMTDDEKKQENAEIEWKGPNHKRRET